MPALTGFISKPMVDEKLLQNVVRIARAAGDAVMDIYNSGDFAVEIKADNTPLTKADKKAHEIIEAGLKEISDYPILSEEGEHRVSEAEFWCVDPIDGTKEFIKKSGEFTVNIGLIKDGEPVLGVVGVPAQNQIFYGAKNLGAFKQVGDGSPQEVKAEFSGSVPVVAGHHEVEDELKIFLQKLGEHEIVIKGSSLKFCLVAEGLAAVYPRFYGSHLWDTAAGDAVLRAAGGRTLTAGTGQPLVYDPAELTNPFFVAATSNFNLVWYTK